MSISITALELAHQLGGRLVGRGDTVINGVAKIEEAGPSDLTFIANVKYARYLNETSAGVVLIAPKNYDPETCRRTVIEVEDPYFSFLTLLETFHPRIPWLESGIHPTAVVAEGTVLGNDVNAGALSFIGPRTKVGARTVIFPHAVIAADVIIGEDCEIHSHVSIREGTRIGNRVVIQNGAVIGGDGFGFAPSKNGYRKIPQRGIVVIEDDVEIGANTAIDRATLGETVIRSGTKLDNLIQVAHNVTIGRNTVVAAQSGVSGSTRVGDECQIGGQVGIVGHLHIGNGVMIGAQSGVGSDVEDRQIISGSPARSHSLWKRIEAALTRLPDLFKRVRALESEVFGENSKRNIER